ncbi:MAG: hypothetical protein JW751_03190 [Polyangiaceae bacterium]|nr:hypothetical protein [Polyangiaceae bacterium]
MKALFSLNILPGSPLFFLALPLAVLAACSSEEGEDPAFSSGGHLAIGGVAAGGGATGGETASGGLAAGGAATGGSGNEGMGTGGTTGGVLTGGTTSTGGAFSGGTPTGGTTSTGGAPFGGTLTGGTTITGGAPSGGTSAGGTTSTGGGTPSGGTPTGGASTGGMSSGGLSTGGVATGGSSTGGTPSTGGSSGGSGLADEYPCDESTDGYDAVVTASGSSWSVNGGGGHASLLAALQAALASGGASEDDKRRVLLVDDGEIPADAQMRIPSNTVFNACGTITVVEPGGGSDRSPCYARSASHIDIPHITIRGIAQYGCFFRETEGVHIGVADIRLSGGLGMRFDNNPGGNDWANSASNTARKAGFRLDDVYVENVSHGVEFYGIRDVSIGAIVARNTSQAGLMLNNTVNVDVGLVDGQGVSPGAGYAVFRMANDNGKDWDTGSHPMSIHVGKVIARESGGSNGQGIFCLTDSGGVTIDEVDLENTASNSIWLEWCTNVVIGNPNTQSRIHNSGNVFISYGTDTRMSNDLVFENIAITGTSIVFNHDCPPNIDWINVTRDGSSVSECE